MVYKIFEVKIEFDKKNGIFYLIWIFGIYIGGIINVLVVKCFLVKFFKIKKMDFVFGWNFG